MSSRPRKNTPSLFAAAGLDSSAPRPLADRLRPGTLADVVGQDHLLGPDGIRLEFFGDPSLDVPVRMDHIHLFPQDVPAMQAWYAKILGGVPCKRALGGSHEPVDCVDIPGVILAMSKSETKLDPTSGHSLDHIGFDVRDLPDFLERAEAQDATITQKLTPSNFSSKMRVAFITDPWGTKMEVTQGIAP